MRLFPGLLAFGLVTTMACGGSGPDDSTAPGPTAPTSTPTTAPRPPATKGPKTITFGPITFHTPSDWDIYVREAADTTAYIGVLAGGPGDVELRVITDYMGTVDALQPTECIETSEKPSTVELIESGFAPVGSLTAEFRRWRFRCPGQDRPNEHGVWLLPVSHIAIVEQSHSPAVVDVVTTAKVA